jgi:hypothetical protein
MTNLIHTQTKIVHYFVNTGDGLEMETNLA